MTSSEENFEPGARLGQFEILKLLGRGGMGSVYLAEDTRLGRRVALKVILPDIAEVPEFRRRFEAEARGAAAIEHPNIVPVYSAGLIEGHLYLAMRPVGGESLGAALTRFGPLSPEQAAQILTPIAAALDAAHAAGLVHRDVTPANILLEGELGTEGVYLSDFGLVRLAGEESGLTRTGQVIANLDHAAPEQIEGRAVDARTDVFALGCVFYRMLSGEPPFRGDGTQKMWKIVNEPLPSLGPGEDLLDAVIARATAKAPARRYRSAGDLARAAADPHAAKTHRLREQSVATGPAAEGFREPGLTEPLLRHPAEQTSEVVTEARSTGTRSKGRTIALAAAALLLAVGAGVAVALIASSGGSGPPTVVRKTVTEITAGATSKPQPRDGGEAEPKAPPENAAPRLRSFSGSVYSSAIPSGWVSDPEVIEEPPYYANKWIGPGSEPYVRIEGHVPAPSVDVVTAGEDSRAQTSGSSDYREISYGLDIIGGREALRWEFEVEGDRRVVFAFIECNVNLALVGSALPGEFGRYQRTFEEVAEATRSHCE